MRTIVLLGNFGATNIGDEALLESLLHLFRSEEKSDTLRLHVMTSNPTDTLKRYEERYQITASPLFPVGFRTLYRYPQAIHALKKLGKVDHVIFGGGGLFTDHPSAYPVILWWVQMQGLRLVTRAPIHIVGQSFGPLTKKATRLIKKQILRQASHIVVRDTSSVALAKEILPQKATLHLPDLAFFYPKSEGPQEEHTDFRVAISLRPWGDTAAWIDTLATWVQEYNQPMDIRLIPMQTTREEDVSILSALREKLHILPQVQVRIQYVTSFAELELLLRTCQLAIGQRLHFLICSLLAGVPAVGIAYSEKVRSLLEESGVPLLQTPDVTELQKAVDLTHQETEKKRRTRFIEEKQVHQSTLLDIIHGRAS